MKTVTLAALVAAFGILGVSLSSAAPINAAAISQAASQGDQMIQQVAGGCGRGWHRGRYGRCRRNW